MRITPSLLCLFCFPVAVTGCGDDRADGYGSTTLTAGTVTAGGTDTTAGTTGDTAGTGGTTSDTTAGTTTDTTGGSTTGAGTGDPPSFCDFAKGCYDDTMTLDTTRFGVNSWSPAGCEGEDFKPSATFQVGGGGFGGPEAHRAMPVLADYTGDGNLDVFLNPRKQTAYIVPGNGMGAFLFDQQSVISLPTPFAFSSGWGADAGDFDGDGDIEPVVGDHGYDSAVWFNNGNNTFSLALEGLRGPSCQDPWSGSCSSNHNGAGFADFNNDGNLDIILGGDQFSGENIVLKHGDGNGTWSDASPPTLYGSTGYFSAADMDNDGDLDIFGFTSGSSTSLVVQVFENSGTFFASAGQYPNAGTGVGSADPRQGGVGDVNCDGFVDIAAGGSIYLSNGANAFVKAVDVDTSKISHLADMNGDGHLDLITQDSTVGLAMYYNDGTGMNWQRELDGLPDETYAQLGTTMMGGYGIDVGDIDGNGNLDIVRIAEFGEQWRFEAWVR